MLAAWFGPEVKARIEQRRGNNVEVYLSKDDFESVPFPDRGRFVGDVGFAWCSNSSRSFLPSVVIRDLRSGDRFDTYNCLLSSFRPEGRVQPAEIDATDLRLTVAPKYANQNLTGRIRTNAATLIHEFALLGGTRAENV
jgi:hypothetical protein